MRKRSTSSEHRNMRASHPDGPRRTPSSLIPKRRQIRCPGRLLSSALSLSHLLRDVAWQVRHEQAGARRVAVDHAAVGSACALAAEVYNGCGVPSDLPDVLFRLILLERVSGCEGTTQGVHMVKMARWRKNGKKMQNGGKYGGGGGGVRRFRCGYFEQKVFPLSTSVPCYLVPSWAFCCPRSSVLQLGRIVCFIFGRAHQFRNMRRGSSWPSSIPTQKISHRIQDGKRAFYVLL